MKKREIVSLYNALFAIKQDLIQYKKEAPIKFKYGVTKLLNELQVEINPLVEIETENLKIIEKYREKERELLKEYGKPVEGKEGMVQIPEESRELVDKKLKEYQETFKDDIEVFTQKSKEYNTILDEEVDIILYKIHSDYLPEWLGMETLDLFTKFILLD